MVSFSSKNDNPLVTVDTIRSMDYSRGYFYGRYLACGYTVGSLVCLPVSVDDTVCHDRVTPYLKGMTQLTSFCGICVDNGALAEHIRNDWGISFSDKTPPMRMYQSVLQLYRSRWDCWLAIYLIRRNHYSKDYSKTYQNMIVR